MGSAFLLSTVLSLMGYIGLMGGSPFKLEGVSEGRRRVSKFRLATTAAGRQAVGIYRSCFCQPTTVDRQLPDRPLRCFAAPPLS